MTEVAIRPGATRHGATTGRKNESEENGRTVPPVHTSDVSERTCGPHRANRGANINHAALYPRLLHARTHAYIYIYIYIAHIRIRVHAIDTILFTLLSSFFQFSFSYFPPPLLLFPISISKRNRRNDLIDKIFFFLFIFRFVELNAVRVSSGVYYVRLLICTICRGKQRAMKVYPCPVYLCTCL